jgi:hypothetical protein
MRISQRVFVVAALNLVVSTATLAQAAITAPAICGSSGSSTTCNGISVGMPKVFDNRSLTLQLEALQRVLQQQQTTNSTIDLKSVMAALANTQGLTQSEVSTVFSLLGNPTPSTGLTKDVKTGNVDSNGNALPDTTDTQTTKNVASVTPAAPSFDSFATLPSGFKPTFGPSASDLLNDQINLNYQIINLQMILERALSDRLYADCKKPLVGILRPNCTRLQTVLGFNVTIDPPRIANDAVAVIEVTLTRSNRPTNSGNSATNPSDSPQQSSDGADHNLSLVAMMPLEKTYNSAALSSSSHAYSGAAVVNAFQVSGGYRKRNQTFYVYRDTDTLAYERMTDDGQLVFGWMFRPVLGRRSVSPGLRQLFAVISLPRIDCDQQQIAQPDTNCRMDLTPSIRTYWKKFDRATQTSFEEHDANRASKFWYNLSLGLSRPQIFHRDSYVNTATYHPLKVYSSAEYESELRPIVTSVAWHSTGEKTVVVSVTGRNYFTNTQVRLGDTIYSEASKNLIIQSEQSFDLITTVDQLAAGPGAILGRYGLSVPLVQGGAPPGIATITDGFRIEEPQIGPAIDGYRTLDISLMKRNGAVGQYLADRDRIVKLEGQLKSLDANCEKATSNLATKENELKTLENSKKRESAQIKTLNDEIVKLRSVASDAQQARDDAQKALENAKESLYKHYALTRSELSDSLIATGNSNLPPPIVSVNGTAVRMPEEIYEVAQDNSTLVPAHVEIHASFPDSAMTKGAALIRVSWPFYNPDSWTVAMLFKDADDQFKVDRVSAKTILIRREGGSGFDPVGDGKCWKFVAGDTAVQLATSACPYVPKPAPTPAKGKAAPTPNTEPAVQGLRDIASVTVGEKETLPSQAVLLAPDSGVYHVTIPDFPNKKPDAAAKPIAMKQNDSAWIKITLPQGKIAKTVEANGINLVWRVLKADATTPPNPKNIPPQTIEVEITRALTAKVGSIDVSVFDASGMSVARQTITVACNECKENKGD